MEDVPCTAQRRADFFNSLIFKFVYFFTYTHGGRSIYSAGPYRAGFCTFLRLRSAMSNTFFFYNNALYHVSHEKRVFFHFFIRRCQRPSPTPHMLQFKR